MMKRKNLSQVQAGVLVAGSSSLETNDWIYVGNGSATGAKRLSARYLTIFFCAISWGASAQELIVNGDMETGAGAVLTSWTNPGRADGNIYRFTGFNNTTGYSAYFSNSGTILGQNYAQQTVATQAQNYTLSFNYAFVFVTSGSTRSANNNTGTITFGGTSVGTMSATPTGIVLSGISISTPASSISGTMTLNGQTTTNITTATTWYNASTVVTGTGGADILSFYWAFKDVGLALDNISLIPATPPGPDATNTTVALRSNSGMLRGVMDRRLSDLALMSSYDCQTFDKYGVCLSFQARYTNFDSFNEGSGILTAAYRLTDNVRLGTFIDYRASETEPTGIKFSNDLPTFGAFVGYSQHLNGTGLQGKALAAVQNGNATVTRDNSLTRTEPGSGKGSLNSYMVSGELGWGFAISPSMLATPYVGVRYTDATRGGYTEGTVSGTVDYPVSYSDYSQRLTTATAGVRLAGMLTDKVGYQIGAGLEHDLRQQTSAYSGTSTISGLETFAINVDGVKNRTRGVGSVGMFYQVEKNQRLISNVSIRNQAYTSQTAVSAMAGYQVAF